MKKSNFIYLLLISVSYLSCKCYGDACSGGVNQNIGVQLIDKTTNKPLNANLHNISLDGFTFASPTKTTGKDSSIVRFGGGGAFGKKGTFDGVFKIDGVVVGKFLLTLDARDCCGDYPESGTIEVKQGNMVAQATGSNGATKIFQSSDAFFILKL